MPELPEVETVVRQLRPQIYGKALLEVELLDPKLRRSVPEVALVRGRVDDVYRSGKQIVIAFAHSRKPNKDLLLIHLRMTGRLIWSERNKAKRALARHYYRQSPTETGKDLQHLRARLHFAEGDLLFFDVRRFGTVELADHRTHQPLGLEPLSDHFTVSLLRELLSKRKQPMKSWLMRQDLLVGIGNIYASEILFHAGISPLRRADRLNNQEIPKLYRAIRQILERAIRHCGTTFSDFQDTTGETGSYQRFLKVYDRKGEGCYRCDGRIRRIVQQQRSTFYCPKCQSVRGSQAVSR